MRKKSPQFFVFRSFLFLFPVFISITTYTRILGGAEVVDGRARGVFFGVSPSHGVTVFAMRGYESLLERDGIVMIL